QRNGRADDDEQPRDQCEETAETLQRGEDLGVIELDDCAAAVNGADLLKAGQHTLAAGDLHQRVAVFTVQTALQNACERGAIGQLRLLRVERQEDASVAVEKENLTPGAQTGPVAEIGGEIRELERRSEAEPSEARLQRVHRRTADWSDRGERLRGSRR